MQHMKIIAAALLATTMLAGAARADTAPASAPDPHEPTPGKEDSRIRTFKFSTLVPMRVTATDLNPVRIVFRPGESVVNAVGTNVETDQKKAKSGWYADIISNSIVMQPLAKGLPTSIMYLTTAYEGRPYQMVVELRQRPGSIDDPEDKGAYVEIQMVYPKEPSPAAVAAASIRSSEIKAQKIGTRFAQAQNEAPKNWNYDKQGESCVYLIPHHTRWVSDDGQSTYMVFPSRMPRPVMSVFYPGDQDPTVVTPTGVTVQGGQTQYVLPNVYPKILLTRGQKSCALYNEAYSQDGADPGTGTTSPNVLLVRNRGE
jgi:type IV secretory pathway VirB9-like protein